MGSAALLCILLPAFPTALAPLALVALSRSKRYRKAATLQELDALNAMGRIAEVGTWPGVSQDFALAAAYYQQAAKRGHADGEAVGCARKRPGGAPLDLRTAHSLNHPFPHFPLAQPSRTWAFCSSAVSA